MHENELNKAKDMRKDISRVSRAPLITRKGEYNRHAGERDSMGFSFLFHETSRGAKGGREPTLPCENGRKATGTVE